MTDARHAPVRQSSAACERNRDPILGVLREVLPPEGLVLEIASGTGMHAAWMAKHLPSITWQPSDAGDEALLSIEAWREHEQLSNLRSPIRLDVTARAWPVERADAMFCANMIHIAPWICALSLFEGAARVLAPGAPLVLYGPFTVMGKHTAPSNEAFDRSLRERDPRWGVRDQGDVARAARDNGLRLERLLGMPANNSCLLFRRVD